MKFCVDIGGVISKYPEQFRQLLQTLQKDGHTVYILTDMHKRDEVLEMLTVNDFGFIEHSNVYCADYQKYGEFAKARILKQLGIDIFVDDFVGYLTWDSSLGPAPIRLLVAPNGFMPYWHNDWKVRENLDFGRRVTTIEALLKED